MLPESVNQRPVDAFSIGHVAVGFAIAQARVPWWGALLTALIWEGGGENFLKASFPQLFPFASRDSTMNAVLDSVFFMAGWLAGRAITYRRLTGPTDR